MNSEQTIPEGYKEMVSKSLYREYSDADLRKLGMDFTPKTVVYHQNPWTLYRCQQHPKKGASSLPVLMVPSLINRNYIMDLLPGHSLIEAMVQAGLDVFLLDWGTAHPGTGHLGLEHYVGVWLRRAIRTVRHIVGCSRVQLAGQCIGGMMAALYAAHPVLSKDVERLFLLTAPLDFEDSGLLTKWTNVDGFDIVKMTSGFQGIVPPDFFHASFPLLDPGKQLSKYRTLLEHYSIPGFKEIWAALDIWANDNVPFSKTAFIGLIRDFYQNNTFYRGQYTVMGEQLGIENIKVPTLCIAAEQDHVFDEKSARAIQKSEAASKGRLQYHVMPAGHVTLIAAHPIRIETFRLVNQFLTG